MANERRAIGVRKVILENCLLAAVSVEASPRGCGGLHDLQEVTRRGVRAFLPHGVREPSQCETLAKEAERGGQ